MNIKSWITFIVILAIVSIGAHAYTTSGFGNVVTKGLLNSSGTFTGDINWTNLDEYPAACSAGYYASELGDALTCTDSGMVGSTWTDSQLAGGNELSDVSKLTINNTGNAILHLHADTKNIGENDHPGINFTQDGFGVQGYIGYYTAPFSSAVNNQLWLIAGYSSGSSTTGALVFATENSTGYAHRHMQIFDTGGLEDASISIYDAYFDLNSNNIIDVGRISSGTNIESQMYIWNESWTNNIIAQVKIHGVDNEMAVDALLIEDESDNDIFRVGTKGIGNADQGYIRVGRTKGVYARCCDNEAVDACLQVHDENDNLYFEVNSTGTDADGAGHVTVHGILDVTDDTTTFRWSVENGNLILRKA